MWKSLFAEKSKFTKPGRRKALVRGEVPNAPYGACVKAAVLNQCCQVRWSLERLPSCPGTWLGREIMPVPVVSRLDVTGVGNPLCAVMIVESCQPSSAALPNPCMLWKKGTSYKTVVTTRCFKSKPETERSPRA